MKRLACCAMGLALLASGAAVGADLRTDYYQRAAERDLASFRALDLDHDGAVTRAETQVDLDFGPRFNDMDVNRDGVVTMEELRRYIELRYGVTPAAPKT